MADWRDFLAKGSPEAAAPAGLQAQNRPDPAEPDNDWRSLAATAPQAKGQPAWGTGGNPDSVENGWNTPFYQKMFAQIDEATAAGTYGKLVDRDDYTGIVTYDQKTGKRDAKFGDVYENGQRTGNIYDANSGYTRENANWVMGRLTLDSDVFAQMKTPEALEKEVQRQAKQTSGDAAKGATAAAFQGRVDERVDDWSEDGEVATNVATIGAGAAGGAAVGAGIGSLFPGIGTAIGGVVGGVVGGLGAWLNRDEIVDQAARVTVQTELADERHGSAAAFTTALSGAAGLGLKALSPLNNLTHGIYDVSTDGFNDEAAWYAVDPTTGESERPWMADVLGFASMIPDAAGSFGGSIALRAFQGAMGASIIGQTSQMFATGGETFDDRRGDFDNVFLNDDGDVDLLSGAAGVAKIGIDAVQLGGVSGLMRAARDSARLFGGKAAADAAGSRVSTGGFSYQLDDAGRAIEGSRRVSLGILAPSEMLQGVSASMRTRIQAKNTANGIASADDYYQMAVSLGNGARAWRGTVVNAIGEGYEEAVQSVLEPVSHNAEIDWREVGAAALAGTAMGAGMGIAAGRVGANQDERLYAQAQMTRQAMRMPALSKDEWSAKTDVQKRAEASASKAVFEAASVAEANLVADQTVSLAAQFAAPEAKHAAAALAEQSAQLAKAAPKTDLAFRITQTEDADVPGHSVNASLNRVVAMLSAHTEGLELGAGTEADEVLKSSLTLAAVEGRQLLQGLQIKLEQYARTSDLTDRNTIVDEVNGLITEWFDADPASGLPAEKRLARARAVSIILTRDPIDNIGSFQTLLPQANRQLSQYGSDHVLQVGHAILQPLGGDFDGDKLRQQARLVIDDAKFQAARQGLSFVTLDGNVNIGTRHYEEWEITLFADAWAQGEGHALYGAAKSSAAQLERRLTARYGHLPRFAPIMRQLLQDLQQGNTKAREEFLNSLSLQMGEELLSVDPARLTNEWLFLDGVVQQELQAFQQMVAGRIKTKALNTTNVAPIAQTSEGYTRRMEAAATEGQTLAQRIGGTEMFRLFQALRYSAYRSPVLRNETGNNLPLEQLEAFFNMLGEGMVESKLEALRSTDDVTARVQYKLRALSEASGMDGGTQVPVAVLANATVPNVDSAGEFYGGEISVLQSILREEIRVEEGKYAAVIQSDPQLQSRFESLKQLTKPGTKKSSRAGQAFVEVFSETSLYDLLGESAVTLAVDLTVGQYARTYTDQDTAHRRQTKQLLAQAPEYLGRKDTTNIPYGAQEIDKNEVSGFRSVVDSILDYGNHRISVETSGEDAGAPRGALADQSNRAGAKLRQVVADVQQALHTYRGRETRGLTSESVVQLMRENPEWAQSVLELIPNNSAKAFFKVVDGELWMSPWLVEAFTMEPAKAEMHLLKNILLMTYNAKGSGTGREYDNLSDRFHRILYRLANERDGGIRLARFVALMDSAQDVAEFEREVNKSFLGNEAPVVAWIRDTAEFDADRPGGGWSTVLDGAAEREAIEKLKGKTARMLDTLRAEREAEIADAETRAGLRRARDAERGGVATEGNPDAGLLQSLRQAVRAANHRLTVLSPTALEMQAIAAQLTWYERATDKGTNPSAFLPNGLRDAGLEYFGTNFEITRSSLDTRDLDTIVSQPNIAARGEFITMDIDGTPVEFPGLTENFVIDNWDNPQARSFIQSVLFPSVWEPAGDGLGLQQQFLVEPSLAALLNRPHDEVYKAGNEGLYLAEIEGRALGLGSRHSVQNIVNDILLARTSALTTPLDAEGSAEQVREVVREVALALQAVGDLASMRVDGEPLTVDDADGDPISALEGVRRLVKQRLLERFMRNRFSLGSDELGDLLREEIDIQLALTRIDAVERDMAGDTNAVAAAAAETELTQALLTEDTVQFAIDMFGYDDTSPRAADKRQKLHDIVKLQPNLVNKAVWAAPALVKLLNSTGTMLLDPADGLPRLTPDEWHTVGRAVIATFLERASGVPSSDELTVPLFPDYRKELEREKLKYWDPGFTSLIDPLLDPDGKLVQAAVEMHRETSRPHQASSQIRVAELFDRNLLRPEKLGQWTADLPRVQVEADERLKSSGAKAMISMAGLAPQRQVAQSAASRRSFLHPTDDMLSTAEVAADVILNGDDLDTHLPVKLPSGKLVLMPLAQLNGRFASDVAVNGQSIWDLDFPSPRIGVVWPHDLENGVHPTLRAITAEQLRAAVKAAAAGDPTATVSITLAHPDSQPFSAEWMHNVYFEGVSHRSPVADNFESLNDGLWISGDGISPTAQQEALQANKTGSYAIMLAKTFTLREKRRMELNWERKLTGVLQRKTRGLMQARNGQKELSSTLFNAVYKDQKLSHFVRGIDVATGEPALWSADQVIAWQQENPGRSIAEVLDKADLWIPSDAIKRRLYGDSREQAELQTLTEAPPVDYTQFPVFTGTFPAARLRQIKGALTIDPATGTWQKRNLLDTAAGTRRFRGTYSRRTALSEARAARLSQGLAAQREQQRHEIHTARFDQKRDADFIANTEKAFSFAAAARTRGHRTLDWIAAGFPFIPRATSVENQLERALLSEQALAIKESGQRVGWIFRENDKAGDGVTKGVLTGTSLEKPPSVSLTVAPGDVVAVDVDSFGDDMERAQLRLQQIMSRGATIVLVSQANQRNKVGILSQYIVEGNYHRPPGSAAIFVENAREAAYQNVRARLSSLMEERPLSAESSALILELPGIHADENAIIPIEANEDISGEVALAVDLLPLYPYKDFAHPQSAGTVRKVKAQLTTLAETQRAFILQQAAATSGEARDEFELALDKLIERWEIHGDQDGILPAGDFKAGDLVPLVRSDARGTAILLYRHGFEELSRTELEAQLEKAVEETGSAIAVYKPKQKTDATVHEGRIESVQPRGKYGLQAKLWVPLRNFGNKLQLQLNGMKYVVSTRPASLVMPVTRFFRNWGLDFVTDIWSANSKNAWTGRIHNHRWAFAVFGIDFEPELIEFFTGVKRGSGAAYTTAATRTHNILQLLSEELPKQSVRSLDYAGRNGALSADLLQVLQDFAGETQGGDFAWLERLRQDPTEITNDTEREHRSALNGIASATLLYLMAPGSTRLGEPQYQRVLRSGGFNVPGARSSGLKSQLMAPLFTEFFDRMPQTHPSRVLINEKLNEQIGNDSATEGYRLNSDFQVTMSAGGQSHTGWLRIAEVHSSGDNPEMDKNAHERGDRQKASMSTQSMASLGFGGRVAYDRDLAKADEFFTRKGVVDFEGSTLWALLQDVPQVPPTRKHHLPNPAEQEYMRLAADVNDGFRQPLDLEAWKRKGSKQEYDEYRRKFSELVREVTEVYGLKKEQEVMVHYWIRQMLGMPKDRDDQSTAGQVSFEKAQDALADILYNGRHGWLPVVDAEHPQITHSDLTALYLANRDSGKFRLRTSLDTTETAESWSDWVATALAFGETQKSVFDALFLTAVDGALHTFIGQEENLVGLPVTRDDLRRAQLFDPNTIQFALSMDPMRAQTTGEAVILDQGYADFGALFGSVRMGSRWAGKVPSGSAIAQRRAARKKWRKQSGIATPQVTNIRNFRQHGAQWIEEQSTTNAVYRMMLDLRAGMALFNPLLWVSAGFELGVRSSLENISNVILGESAGFTGRAAAAVGASYYSPQEQRVIRDGMKSIGSRTDFKAMLYSSLMFHRERGGNSFLERGTRGFAKWGSFIQDPTWGLKGTVMARHYLEAVLQYVAANPTETVISVEKLVSNLNGNPRWAEANLPRAHAAALATIANLRSLKDTPASLFLRGIYEPLSRNPHLVPNTIGNVGLRLPLMFSGYAMNVLTNITGMQGPAAMIATTLNGKKNPMAGLQSWMAGEGFTAGKDGEYDMSTVMEGLDLSKAFVQGAVTHTSLFALGMLAGGLGIGTGEDEEERRRRRAMEHQRGGIVYDPRDIINDFRNADAVYLDWLPFGLDKLFAVPDPEGTNSAHSMAEPHWMLRQFVSPILGMEKFFETGDVRHIVWGFQDAVGAFPLINAETWADANNTVARLQASVPEDSEGELDSALDAYGFLIRAVSVYERMLFENSFVNMLYVQGDKYDRDQWTLPELDVDGNIIRPDLGQPGASKALEDFVDPITGEVRMSSKDRDWWDATLHGFTENRATLAYAFSLFTGQGLGGSTIRTNMVPKTRTIDKDAVTQDDAESIVMGLFAAAGGGEAMGDESYIMSAFDAQGREMVNETGARAVIQGIWKQSVQLGSPALEGVFIPFEMRQKIQAELMAELIQEGVDLGLSEYDAKGRMYDVWYGPSDDPAVQGLGDLLWSDKIPYAKQEQYFQLNTTYVMGPDGRPWATGMARQNLHNMFGFAPVNRYYVGDVGLPTDGSLNSVDAAQGMNTGMRALEKVDDSWHVPTPEEIGESIEDALKDAMSKSYSSDSGYGGRGFGYGGGGGGSRGGYAYRLNSPVRNDPTYGRSTPYIRVDNPILRRSNIRRERFSSTRGRLNQWQ